METNIELQNDIEQKAEKMIVCQNCGKKEKSIFQAEDSQQASGIASSSYEENGEHFIYCGYRSCFDMSVYRWRNKPNSEGNLCDGCIYELREKGDIEIYANGFHPLVDLHEYMPRIYDHSGEKPKITDMEGNILEKHTWGPWEEGVLEKVEKGEFHPTMDWLFEYVEDGKYFNEEIKKAIENHLVNCEDCLEEVEEIIKDSEQEREELLKLSQSCCGTEGE